MVIHDKIHDFILRFSLSVFRNGLPDKIALKSQLKQKTAKAAEH